MATKREERSLLSLTASFPVSCLWVGLGSSLPKWIHFNISKRNVLESNQMAECHDVVSLENKKLENNTVVGFLKTNK